MTSPFTGLEFDSVIMDNAMVISNPLTNEKTTYEIEDDFVKIPLSAFKNVKLITNSEAQTLLDVSYTRIRELVLNETLQSFNIGETRYFKLEDVLEYKKNRKTGRPRKVE